MASEAADAPEVTFDMQREVECMEYTEPNTDDTTWNNLLAYDIETTGLDPKKDKITVVCLYGLGCEEGVVFNFLKEDSFESQREKLITYLNWAPRLASFNGVRFDAPFIQSALNVREGTVKGWIAKTFDVWEICKTLMKHTFKMSELLDTNGFSCKLGSGLDAIEWAKDETMWPTLESYCLQDARLTWEVSRLPVIKIPRTYTETHKDYVKIVKRCSKKFEIVFPFSETKVPNLQKKVSRWNQLKYRAT